MTNVFKDTHMTAKNKKVLGSAQYLLQLFGSPASHTKKTFLVFSTAFKHFNVHKLIAFRKQRDLHNYENGH